MIKGINIYTKKKQRKIFIINNFEDLNNFDFVKAIPKNAMSVEITSKSKDGTRTVEVDYILESYTKNFKEGEQYE